MSEQPLNEAGAGSLVNPPCYYCGEQCNNLAGNPDMWSLAFCHSDEPGVPKPHHIGCVTSKLNELTQLRTLAKEQGEALEKADSIIKRASQWANGLSVSHRHLVPNDVLNGFSETLTLIAKLKGEVGE